MHQFVFPMGRAQEFMQLSSKTISLMGVEGYEELRKYLSGLGQACEDTLPLVAFWALTAAGITNVVDPEMEHPYLVRDSAGRPKGQLANWEKALEKLLFDARSFAPGTLDLEALLESTHAFWCADPTVSSKDRGTFLVATLQACTGLVTRGVMEMGGMDNALMTMKLRLIEVEGDQ